MLELILTIVGLIMLLVLCALGNALVKNQEEDQKFLQDETNAPCTEEDYNFRMILK